MQLHGNEKKDIVRIKELLLLSSIHFLIGIFKSRPDRQLLANLKRYIAARERAVWTHSWATGVQIAAVLILYEAEEYTT